MFKGVKHYLSFRGLQTQINHEIKDQASFVINSRWLYIFIKIKLSILILRFFAADKISIMAEKYSQNPSSVYTGITEPTFIVFGGDFAVNLPVLEHTIQHCTATVCAVS